MLTKKDDFHLALPNLNMRQIFVEYFNEIHQMNVESDYLSIMQRFINRPNPSCVRTSLEELFASYWQEYILRLPEAIFMKVNDCEASLWENFYRTTFFELPKVSPSVALVHLERRTLPPLWQKRLRVYR